MPKSKVVIQDKAVIAQVTTGNPIGEALRAGMPVPANPMAAFERREMVERLEKSITQLMNKAEDSYQANCHIPGTTNIDPNYITRLSTNEFFFYTKEPLTLKEFEELQNKIAEKAKTMAPGVQLILGSFGVKTDDGKVMNVTPHITCGSSPNVQLIVKNRTSSIDVRYKIPNGQGHSLTLPVLDKKSPSKPMPKIKINGIVNEFTFNNIVQCKTPGDTPFLTAIDVCLDHAYGDAKQNYDALAKKDPRLLEQPVSHVVVSNTIAIEPDNCLSPGVMHVDPRYSQAECKKGVQQQASPPRSLPFGNDLYTIFEVARSNLECLINFVTNNYAYKTSDPAAGRDHKAYTASIDTTQFQKSKASAEFQNFRNKYQSFKGDHLKTQILDDLKTRIQESSSKEELEKLKEELKTSYETDVLNTGQGWFTQRFGLKTSSIKALESMIEQQEEFLSSQHQNPA